MKKLLILISVICAGIGLIACDRTATIPESPLGVSKTNAIKKGEPVDFNFSSEANKQNISWSVTPDKNVQINADGKNARIFFGESGNYTVIATDKEIIARTVVKVDTGQYVPQEVVTVSLGGDSFTVTPSIVDSLFTAGLSFRIESKKSYDCLNSYLDFKHFSKNSTTNSYRLTLLNVIQPSRGSCQNGSQKVSANAFLYPLEEGENKFEIALNEHVYSGKIVRRDKNFTIDWPDASEVSFNKLVVNK